VRLARGPRARTRPASQLDSPDDSPPAPVLGDRHVDDPAAASHARAARLSRTKAGALEQIEHEEPARLERRVHPAEEPRERSGPGTRIEGVAEDLAERGDRATRRDRDVERGRTDEARFRDGAAGTTEHRDGEIDAEHVEAGVAEDPRGHAGSAAELDDEPAAHAARREERRRGAREPARERREAGVMDVGEVATVAARHDGTPQRYGIVVVVVVVAQPPATQASQQLSKSLAHALPPCGGRHLSALGLMLHAVRPVEVVRQQATNPGFPHVERAAHFMTSP
jgi:hypothetical protein